MVVRFPCLVYNRAVARKHRAVQCDLCDSWVYIASNKLVKKHDQTCQKLQKDKPPWYCTYCFRKELPYGSTNDAKLRNLLHGEAFVSTIKYN